MRGKTLLARAGFFLDACENFGYSSPLICYLPKVCPLNVDMHRPCDKKSLLWLNYQYANQSSFTTRIRCLLSCKSTRRNPLVHDREFRDDLKCSMKKERDTKEVLMRNLAEWLIVTVIVVAVMVALCSSCNTNYDEPPLGGDEETDGGGSNHHHHPGHHHHDGGIVVHPDGGVIVYPDGGGTVYPPPCEGGYNILVESDMTGRQEITYLVAGSDEEATEQVTAGEPVVFCITPDVEPVIMAIMLVCGTGQPCPDPMVQAPKLILNTDPQTEIYAYAWWTGGPNLVEVELPINIDMFMLTKGVDLFQNDDWLIYTSWITVGP